MTEQRYGYTYHRVMIDSTRVLDPQFDDALIYVTGAQLELLRNMTQYLNRLSTYVSEYHPSYYLSPTIEDYDTIQAIVADLEDVLMGNPNTIWGYKDAWTDLRSDTASGAGSVWVTMGTVPSGEVWVLRETYAHHNAASTKRLVCYLSSQGETFEFADVPALSPDIKERWQGRLVLQATDSVSVWVPSPGDGKTVVFAVTGYKMAVPD